MDGELLIGGSDTTGSGSVQSDSEVKSAGRLRWILVGVGVLGALVFGLAQWPQSEPPPQASAKANSDAAEPAEEAESPNTTVRETTTTGAPVTAREAVTEETVDGGAITASNGPLLGEVTGLGLALSGGNGRSQILDLDTGETHELETNAEVLAVVDSTLVTRSNSGGRIVLVDLTDADSDGVTISAEQGGYVDYVSTEGGVIWVAHSGPNDNGGPPILEAFNPLGEKVDEFSIELIGFAAFFWSGSTELLQVEGAGIYRRDGDEYRWVSDGALLAYDAPLALIRKCDVAMRCNAAWYDSPDFTNPLALPPPETAALNRFSIAGAGKWLIQTNWNNGSSELIEISSGRVVRTFTSPEFFGPSSAVPISPDGRWLIEESGTRMIAVDLVNGVELELDLPPDSQYGPPPVFIEMNRTAFG